MPLRTTLTHAAWQRGHQLRVAHPERLLRQHRAGFYTRLEGEPGSENWVHFTVPAPILADPRRSVVGHVMLCYRSAGGAVVDAVHVYDGERLITAHDEVNRRPDEWANDRFAVPASPEVHQGLSVRVKIRFPEAGGRIDFASAGCDFLTSRAAVTARSAAALRTRFRHSKDE